MPYKNVETLVSGMSGLPDFTLHLLSRITPERRAELEIMVPTGAKVVFHNGVTDDEYAVLLKRATALVSLSRAEGYGLPLVEAMSLGTPVIASDIPIFREVGGHAASYVAPDSASEFAAAVQKLRDQEHWQEVSRLSVARAAEFSWDESARQLVDVAHDIGAARSRRKRLH
jgi:glycosyltransferase involved in cell wall biosynthesis